MLLFQKIKLVIEEQELLDEAVSFWWFLFRYERSNSYN